MTNEQLEKLKEKTNAVSVNESNGFVNVNFGSHANRYTLKQAVEMIAEKKPETKKPETETKKDSTPETDKGEKQKSEKTKSVKSKNKKSK